MHKSSKFNTKAEKSRSLIGIIAILQHNPQITLKQGWVSVPISKTRCGIQSGWVSILCNFFGWDLVRTPLFIENDRLLVSEYDMDVKNYPKYFLVNMI